MLRALLRPNAILAALFGVALGLVQPFPATAQNAGSALAQALGLMRAGDWAGARETAGPEGSVARDIIEWHRLRESLGSFADTRAFLARRADWPGLSLLRKRSEATIGPAEDPVTVILFFTEEPPQTGNGALRLAEALRDLGEVEQAEAQIVLAWFSLSMSTEEEAAILSAFGNAVAGYHWQRVDMLLWQGQTSAAARLLDHLDAAHRALAEARIALRENRDGVDDLIAAVPGNLAGDPGLAYERMLWRAQKGRNQDAADLILERSETAESLGDPARWAGWRRALAHWSMREGKTRQAYRLAAGHHLGKGEDFNELEWLAGYVALNALGDPERALAHFRTFRQAVDSPISLGRAGYWEGRAAEALGRSDEARAAYTFGAGFQTSFYGQLAAEKAGLAADPALAGQERFAPWESAGFWSSSVMEAARLSAQAGDLALVERFTVHLTESLDRTGVGQLAAWAESQGMAHVEVMIAKHAVRQGQVLVRPYYPAPQVGVNHPAVPPEWVLAISRRESEFDPTVQSHAGARGLMQLMPPTAEAMARRLDLPYDEARLVSDATYNARLGVEYLSRLFEDFGKNPVLVAAAYNAGPNRVAGWVEQMGRPAGRTEDVIDWIEHIPFEETRNYVMRVTESLYIYRARLAGALPPLSLSRELTGR